MRVFVTTELYPFTHGGIGRAIGNMLATSTAGDLAETAVVWAGDELDVARFSAVYPQVKLVLASRLNYELVDEDGISYPPEWAFTNTEWHWRSVSAMQGLKRLAREAGEPRYVEFPDWGGLGFASVQEKLLGRAFSNSVLAVRLHTTDSLLATVDSRPVDKHLLAIHDLERKTLADCDRIVMQLPAVGEAVRRFFGFSEADWRGRACLHAPPVLLDSGDTALRSVQADSDTAIIFPSKIQHLKRPELFVRGACGFLRGNTQYRGSIVFAAHSTEIYETRIQRMIPPDLSDRFIFLRNASPVERQALISRSICVTTSLFESFCLSAYEASLAGGICVLNSENPAFGEQSPWVDGVNCYKFDGRAEGLAQALTRAFAGPALSVVQVPQDPAPWTLPATAVATTATNEDTERPLVSVVVPHYNLGDYLPRTLDSILASTYENLEILVVDDCSTDKISRLAVSRLESIGERLRIVRNAMNVGLAATRNVAVTNARGEFVLTLDADDLISPSFIELAVKALQRNPTHDFVVPQAGFFFDADEAQIGTRISFRDYAIFYGEARALGWHDNRFSTATCLARTSVLRQFGYREELDAYEDWDLYQRAVAAGKRFIVTNGVHFFYRRRSESMYHSPERASRHRSLYHDLLRDKALNCSSLTLPMYVLEGALVDPALVQKASEEVMRLNEQLDFYRKSRVVFAALRTVHYLDNKAPFLAKFGRKMAVGAWRIRRRLHSRIAR
ncbi:glycosyltransferase [Paraburkholderia sp. RCC_158]|uniref:glycosyltransferase n=1 Tax=Paraburkholderia sp. RCC_158 TaxID=3239220 RepID=UPI003525963D